MSPPSFYNLPPAWNPGYAIPKYVAAEPPGRGTYTTKWLPRRTISQLNPDILVKTSSLSGSSIEGSSIEGSSIHGDTIGGQAYKGKDPLKAYGQEAAKVVMAGVKMGEGSLKQLLDEIDKSLYPAVMANASQLQKSGLSKGLATQQGMATAFTKGIAKEFFNLGKGKKPKANSQLGLSGITSTLSNTASKVGNLSCKVANNPLTPIAAGAATSIYGGGPQTGVAGTMVARSLCNSGGGDSAGPGYMMPAASGLPSWAIPAAIGGGALLLVLVLK